MRYNYNKIKNSKYLTSRLPKINGTGDRYIISRQGDRLDLLAQQFYEDVAAWWIIADANNLGKGDLHVPPGLQIRIPVVPPDLPDKFETLNENR